MAGSTWHLELPQHSFAVACYKHERALQVFEKMKAVGKLKPTATTYGCLLKVCGLRGDVTTAFKLYKEAFEVGVLATDECHNMLIDVCSDAGRWAPAGNPMVSLLHCMTLQAPQ